MAGDPRLVSPAAARNLIAITESLAGRLPGEGLVLEVASGPGEHACAWAARFPALRWQPSDVDERAIQSIRARRADAGLRNLLPPIHIDLARADWERSVDRDLAAIIAARKAHSRQRAQSVGLKCGRLVKVQNVLKTF